MNETIDGPKIIAALERELNAARETLADVRQKLDEAHCAKSEANRLVGDYMARLQMAESALSDEREKWQTASGLVGIHGGIEQDPSSVTPEILEKHMESIHRRDHDYEQTRQVLMRAPLDRTCRAQLGTLESMACIVVEQLKEAEAALAEIKTAAPDAIRMAFKEGMHIGASGNVSIVTEEMHYAQSDARKAAEVIGSAP